MKKYISILATCLSLVACDSFKDLNDVKEIAPISVNVAIDFNIDNVAEMKDLTLKFDNYEEDLHYEKSVNGENISVEGILPGIYNINVTGTAIDTEGTEYYLNGNMMRQSAYLLMKQNM